MTLIPTYRNLRRKTALWHSVHNHGKSSQFDSDAFVGESGRLFANTILLMANAIFSESFLSFFGLGDPDVITWGAMLEEAYNWGAFTSFAWWVILAPGGFIVLLIMAFYLLGDALDEILNPKLRKR